MGDEFRVVTHKRWLAETFAEFGAVQDFGFDIDPATAQETVWWAPGAWVASAHKAGVELPLTSCGPRWLDNLPYKFRGRDVCTMTMEQCKRLGQEAAETKLCEDCGEPLEIEVFIKLPEAKLDEFPARIHAYNRHWTTTMDQYHIPDDTLVQCQGVIEFDVEARIWGGDGDIYASSLYRIDDAWWGTDEFDNLKHAQDYRMLLVMMRLFVKKLIEEVELPPGWVIDVGREKSTGRVFVVEANAAWSSGPYDGDPAGIYAAIRASHDWDGQHEKWRWQPNPVFNNVRPLKVVTR